MKSFNFRLVCLTLLLAGFNACKPSTTAPIKDPRVSAVPVTVVAITNASWDKTVSIVGTLYPKDEATISAQVEGQIEKTLVDFGDRVQNEQQIADIDTTLYEAQVEQAVGNMAKAEANLANARQNFERVEKLQKGGIASASDYDQARALLDQWNAESKAAHAMQSVAELNLHRSRVKAPFNGAVARRLVGRGDFVKVGSPLFELVNDSVLKFIFAVPERHGSLVQKGLPVTFGVDNYPGETFTGSVYLISPAVTMGSRAFSVGALVTNTSFRLKANTFGRGSLVLQKGVETPVIPLECVVSFAGVTKVFIVEGEVARSRTVTVGRIQRGLQEVLSGVHEGEKVVLTGQSRLSDGAFVSIQSRPPAPDKDKAGLAQNQASR